MLTFIISHELVLIQTNIAIFIIFELWLILISLLIFMRDPRALRNLTNIFEKFLAGDVMDRWLFFQIKQLIDILIINRKSFNCIFDLDLHLLLAFQIQILFGLSSLRMIFMKSMSIFLVTNQASVEFLFNIYFILIFNSFVSFLFNSFTLRVIFYADCTYLSFNY